MAASRPTDALRRWVAENESRVWYNSWMDHGCTPTRKGFQLLSIADKIDELYRTDVERARSR